MCLLAVDAQKPRSWGNGYKVFHEKSGYLHSKYHNTSLGFAVSRLNTKLTAIESLVTLGNCEYTSGFHVFINKRDAKMWRIIHGGVTYRVRYSGAHTAGIDESGFKTVIAKHIRILGKS